jgi:hypothetical protein
MRLMNRFKTIKEAKDFLSNSIAAEAEREGIPLSDVERKMLYFSETGWTLPDIGTVNEEFERDYDQNEYEQKIAGLARTIEARNRTENPAADEAWNLALLMLSEEDHYLTVLTTLVRMDPKIHGHGFIPTVDAPAVRPAHDRLKLWATALLVSIIIMTLIVLSDWMKHR